MEKEQKKKPAAKAGKVVIINPPEKKINEMFDGARLSPKIRLVLQAKAAKAGIDESVARRIYVRGMQSYNQLDETDLTPDQLAMNRVNSFIAHGAAFIEDADLIDISEKVGMKGTGGAMRPHIKREKSPYNNRTMFHVVDAKGNRKFSTGDEMEARRHLASKYRSYMGEEVVQEMQLKPSKRLIGTDSLVKTYKDDTPGEQTKVVKEANKMKGEDPCWDGYKMVGQKKKGGKEVPNCVPESVEMFEAAYKGNIGMMELVKFHREASPDQKRQFQRHVEKGQHKHAWKLVQHVTKTKLVGKEFGEQHEAMFTNLIVELKTSTLQSYLDKQKQRKSPGTIEGAGKRFANQQKATTKIHQQELKRIGESQEVEEGLKHKVAAAALGAAMALGGSQAHARVTPGGMSFAQHMSQHMQKHKAENPKPTAEKPAAEKKKGPAFSKEYLQKVSQGKHPRPMVSKEKADELLKKHYSEEVVLDETPAWTRKEGKNPKGGLNRKGIASYRAENPGSKLSMAVTTKPSKLKKGSKAANRRKSFCARMSGVEGPMEKNGKPTRKALALRKWNC